jgi:hypothetical protein
VPPTLLEAPVNDLMDLLRIQFFRNGCVTGHIGKKDGHLFAFTLKRTAGRQNFAPSGL